MKEFVFNTALGDNLSPFASNKKEIAPVVAAALIAGGSALVGGIGSQLLNNASVDKTNDANMQINREQLANQRYLYDQQRADERFLVNQAYERNRPINQVKELREAGINPAFAMDSGAFGTQTAQVGTAPSLPSVSSPIPVQSHNFDSFGLGVSNAGSIVSQSLLEAKNQERADYALASDIEVQHMNARANFMNAVTKAREAGVNEEWIKSQIADAERNYWLNVDKHAQDKEFRDRELDLQSAANEIQQYNADTQRLAVQNNIHLSKSQIAKISQEIKESKERVTQMILDGESKRAIEAWIHDKEMYMTNILGRQWRIYKNSDDYGFDSWESFCGGLFSPIKGIISIGVHN